MLRRGRSLHLLRHGRLPVTALLPPLVALLLTAAVLVPGATASPARPAALNPCFSKAQAHRHLNGRTVGVFKRLLACDLTRLRPASAGAPILSSRLSVVAKRILTQDEHLSFDSALADFGGQIKGFAHLFCRRHPYRYAYYVGGSSPPGDFTPTSVTRGVRDDLAPRTSVLRDRGTRYGAAVVRHVLFGRPAQAHPLSYMWIGLKCR